MPSLVDGAVGMKYCYHQSLGRLNVYGHRIEINFLAVYIFNEDRMLCDATALSPSIFGNDRHRHRHHNYIQHVKAR